MGILTALLGKDIFVAAGRIFGFIIYTAIILLLFRVFPKPEWISTKAKKYTAQIAVLQKDTARYRDTISYQKIQLADKDRSIVFLNEQIQASQTAVQNWESSYSLLTSNYRKVVSKYSQPQLKQEYISGLVDTGVLEKKDSANLKLDSPVALLAGVSLVNSQKLLSTGITDAIGSSAIDKTRAKQSIALARETGVTLSKLAKDTKEEAKHRFPIANGKRALTKLAKKIEKASTEYNQKLDAIEEWNKSDTRFANKSQ